MKHVPISWQNPNVFSLGIAKHCIAMRGGGNVKS